VGREVKWQTVQVIAKVIARTREAPQHLRVSLFSAALIKSEFIWHRLGIPWLAILCNGSTGQPLENLPASRDGGYFLHRPISEIPPPHHGEQINLEAALPSDSHCIIGSQRESNQVVVENLRSRHLSAAVYHLSSIGRSLATIHAAHHRVRECPD